MTARKPKVATLPVEPDGLCNDPVCGLSAVIDGWCILHAPDPGGDAPAAPAAPAPNPAAEFNGGAAVGLAAILLEVTADCLADDGKTTDELVGGLAAVTGMPLDVAAGLLLATTTLATAGELTYETLHAAAERYTTQAQEDN